jgi:hypothetical protein
MLKKILTNPFSTPVFILAVHLLLLYIMAGTNLIASLFAAGDHIPYHIIFIAIIFLILRLMSFLYIPGFIVVQLMKYTLNKRCRNKSNQTNQ